MFYKVLNKELKTKSDVLKATEELAELSDEQWHKYQLIDSETKEAIESWIEKTFDITSIRYIENVIFIIAHLGLEESFKLLENALEHEFEIDKEIYTEIKEAVDELRDHIDNPYSGM